MVKTAVLASGLERLSPDCSINHKTVQALIKRIILDIEAGAVPCDSQNKVISDFHEN